MKSRRVSSDGARGSGRDKSRAKFTTNLELTEGILILADDGDPVIRPHKRQKTLECFWSSTSKKPNMVDAKLVEENPDTGGIHLATAAGEQDSTGGGGGAVSAAITEGSTIRAHHRFNG